MAEQRMRELGHDMTRVAWLAERLRRGDLERSMVELAAYAGDRQAREVLGTQHIPVGVNGPGCWTLADWLRGLERWPGALREAELACDVVMWGKEAPPYPWRNGADGMAKWLCVVAELKGEQRVREAICERLREWALR